MKVLELFSGTGSVSKICKELGWEVYSVDIDDKFYPVDKKVNILEWNYKDLDFKPDIIWASPPCNSFSKMLFLTRSRDQINKKMREEGLPLLYKAREIIDYFKPKYYFIENPDTGRMKDYIKDLPFYRVSYCRYSDKHSRKDTRIWTNLEGFNPKWCNHKGKHEFGISATRKHDRKTSAGRILKKNTIKAITRIQDKYSIPPDLIRDLFNTILFNTIL